MVNIIIWYKAYDFDMMYAIYSNTWLLLDDEDDDDDDDGNNTDVSESNAGASGSNIMSVASVCN